ncbi:flagellar alpha dynein [Microcoleus sp. B5-D4]|uniref:flagellar alpha dynein n=1 Tax=unclassified Microcoleus TaxID=2642155 RepID=UPI002FD195CF
MRNGWEIECLSDGNDESLRQELKAAKKQLAEWDKELNELHERNGDLGLKVQMLEQELKEARRSREANKKSAPTVAVFPEPADLLNQLKAQRKKSRADLADMEAVLEILDSES